MSAAYSNSQTRRDFAKLTIEIEIEIVTVPGRDTHMGREMGHEYLAIGSVDLLESVFEGPRGAGVLADIIDDIGELDPENLLLDEITGALWPPVEEQLDIPYEQNQEEQDARLADLDEGITRLVAINETLKEQLAAKSREISKMKKDREELAALLAPPSEPKEAPETVPLPSPHRKRRR